MDNNLPNLDDLYAGNKEASNALKIEQGLKDFDTPDLKPSGNPFLGGRGLDYSQLQERRSDNITDFDTYANVDNNEIAAQRQSALGHLAGTLYNTGLELTLGTASMAGRAVDLQSHAAMLTGAQDDANNFFSEWIDTLKEDINYDVYRTNWSKGFNPLSTGWWAEMVPQLASSLTIAVPVGGVMKGLSALGAVNKVAKGLKGMGSLTKSAAGLAGGYKNLSKGVLGGLASRSIESLAEGSETYKQVYSELVNSGYSEEQARGAASEAASSVYKNNWLLSASDMLQYSMVMNGFSKKGELLKQIGLEAGEEGSQYFINKEAEYDALRSVNATPYSSFGERAKTYLSDSEFWNSVVAGGLGGGVFHAVGEFMENRPTPEQKLTHQADKVAEQNATVLAGDKKGKLDYSDDAFRNLALDAITGNKGADLKELYNQTLTATPEELETLSIKPEDVARAKEHIAMIDDIQNEWNALSLNKNLTPDARVIAASSLVESKLKAKRSAQLSKEIIQDIESKIHPLLTEQINGDPNVFNLKIALLNAEALKGTHLEGRFDEQVEKLKALSPGTTLKALSTPEDGAIIAKIKDNYLLQDEINKLKEGYTNANGAMNNEKKATEKLNSVADEANKEKARVKFENETEYPDTHLEKLAKLKNSIYAEVAQAELDKREAARAERKKQEDIEAVNNAKKPLDKKADIERRRQEELKERVVYDRFPTVEDGEFKIIGDPNNRIYRINETTGRPQELDESNGLWSNTALSPNLFMESTKRSGFEKSKNKINAKYDAELKALEQQPKSNQFEQDKKADIERRRQEDLEYANFGNRQKEIQEGRENTKKIFDNLKQKYPANTLTGQVLRLLEKLIDINRISTISEKNHQSARGGKANGSAFEGGIILDSEIFDRVLNGEERAVKTFIHELFHQILNTSQFEAHKRGENTDLSSSQIKAWENLERLYEKAKNISNAKSEYGFTNLSEFLAEAFSNQGFQKELSDIKGEGKDTTLFKEILNSLLDFFKESLSKWAKRFNKPIPEINSGLLQDVMYWSEQLLDINKPYAPDLTTKEINTKYDAELAALEASEGEPFEETQTVEELEAERDEALMVLTNGDLSIIPEVVEEESDFGDIIRNVIRTFDEKIEKVRAGAVDILDEVKKAYNNPQPSPDGVEIDTTKLFDDDYREFNKSSDNLISWTPNDPNFVWINNPSELAAGTEVYFKIDANNDQHVETVGGAAVTIYRKSDNRRIGWIYKNRSMELREAIFNNRDAVFSSTITRKSRGPIRTTADRSINTPEQILGENYYVGFGSSKTIMIPNKTDDMNNIPSAANNVDGQVTIIGKGANGMFFPLSVNVRTLSDEEKSFVKSLIQVDTTADNFDKIAEVVNEITYIGRNSGENYPELYLDFGVMGVNYADEDGTEFTVGYDRIGEDDHFDHNLYRILNDPRKKRNVLASKANIIGFPYTDPATQEQYDSYNQFLSKAGVISASYTPMTNGRPTVFGDPFLFFDKNFKLEEGVKKTKTNVGSINNKLPGMGKRMVKSTPVAEPVSTREAKDWFKTNFPNVPLHVVDDVAMILNDGGPAAWGAFVNASVLLAKDAPNSTVYHEAFHVVFDMMLNDKAREAIYQQASKRYNIPLEEIDTIEERLAEEFRNHMILPKESKGVIYDFFKRLYNIIRDFILPNNINIDELFYRASNGIIQTNPRRVRIAEQFKSTAAKRLPVPGFTPEMEEDAVNYIATEFLSLLDERFDKMIDIRQIAEKDVKNFGYIDVIKFEGEERSKNQEQFSAGMQNLLSELKDKIYEQSHDNPALRQIHSKFDLSVKEKELGFRSLKQKAIDVLVDFGVGVRIIEKDATEFMSADIEPIVLKNIDKVEDVETENELKDETRHKEAWMDSYGEAPIEEYKVGPKIKRLFKVIPKLVSYNELDGTYETEVSAFNTIKYVDNRNLFNIVKRELHAEASPTDMVEKLIAVARTSPYKELFIVANWLNTADMHDRSIFFAAFSNAKNNYISVNISTENDNGYDEFDDYYTEDTKDKKYRVRIVENNRNTVTKGIQHEWRKMFVAKAVDPTSKSGEYTKTFLASEAEAFASLPKDITTIDQGLGAISNYFKAIGIDLDMIAVKNQFGTNIANVKGLLYSPNGSITAVHKVIVAGADPFNSQGSLFKSLSQAYKNYYPELGSDNIKRGAKTIHTFANKTFLTKMVERIKGNPESLTEFEYNSIWARLLKSNPAYRNNFNEYILSEVKVDKKSGVEYDNLTPVDDVLQKVLLFHNNDSNKALYNTLTPADNAVMRLISFQKFQRPDVVQFLRMHYGMELARIIKATAFHDKIKNETDPVKKQELMDHLIENYDYKKGDDKLSRTGNVFKLQNFKSNVFYELTSKIIASSKGPDSKINMTTDDIAVFNQEINRMINNEAVFFKNILTKFGKLDAQTNTSQYFDVKNVDELLLDFAANSWLTNIEQSNLFMGGSEFYKDPIDAGKRASQLVAPGVDRNPETDLGQGSSDTIRTIVIETEKFIPQDGPYKGEKIDYTDAQGFCSVEEFLDVQSATGKWDYTLEKTQDRLLNGEPTLFADKLSLQPLKPHYYGRIEDPVRGLSIPIQVKYAEVPLTGPYVEGNEKLTMLRNYMKEHNIQQAVFDTTIKVGTQQKISWKDIADNKKPFVYELKKENYKRQTEVPEHHIDNEILFGTQLRKLILSGLNMSDETKSYDVAGVMMSAKEVFDLYQDLTARNVIESTNNLKAIVKSPRKLLKKFKEQVIKDGLSSQYDLSLKLKDGRLIIPPTMSKAFEFLYNSMFNKVIKQKIKGGQFVQVAPVGNEDLQFVRNDKGIITEAEVLLPWWTREFIPVGKDGEPDMTKIPEAILKAVGYRIPTEAKYSMLSFKVKGFLPKDAGSQIVCAPEVVKQMGSDFDVDKLYVMFYEFDSKGNKLEYGDINESTTKQRNNKMLDLIRAILANGQHFDEIVSGNNFDDLIRLDESINGKQAKRDIYSLPSFQYQLRINNLDGAKLIGLAANINIHHSVAQFIDVKIGDTVEDMVKFNNDGKTPSDLEALSLSNTKNVKGESIASVLAQFLAAFVDNVKNPLAAKLNINFLTHPIASLIIRTGNTMDTAMMFINQPIIREFVEEYVAAGATTSAYTRTLTKYKELFKNVENPKAGMLSTKALQDGLKNDAFDPFQKKVLFEFDRLYNISKGINKSIQALRIDSSGVSTNITDNVRKMRNVRDSIVSSIANTSNVFENNMYPMIPAFTDVLAESVENSVDYFPWANPVFEKIHSDVNPQGYFLDDQEVANIDLEYLNYVHQDLAYIKNNNGYKQYVINHLGAKINKILNSYLNSDKSLDNSKKIAIFAENFFIKNLNIEDGKISMSTVDFSTNEKEKLLDAFRTLYNSKESFILEGDEKPTYISNVANGLILYQFFTTGFRKKYGTYLEYLPVDILESLDFTDFWGNKLEEFKTLTNDVRFPELYLRNHSNFGKAPVLQADQVAQIIVENKQPVQIVTNDKMFGTPIVINHLGNPYALRLTGDGWSIYNRVGKLGTMDINEYTEKSEFPGNNFEEFKGEVKPPVIADNPKLELPAGGTINVYWGQPESATSTRILSNLAPRKFNYESIDGVTREYGSVEHAYQSNKNGKFDKNTYDAYVAKGGYGVKIAPKLTEVGKRGNLQVMKDLVVESFVQNPNSNAAKKLMQYNNFTHNTNELIDKAFLEGLKLAQQALGGIPSSNGQPTLFDKMNQVSDKESQERKENCK